jgi:hypothetical protein
MNIIKTVTIFSALIFIGCNKKGENENIKIEKEEKPSLEIITEKISQENLPKEILFEGKPKEITKLKDLKGEHIILLTETGEVPSPKKINDNEEEERDFRIFAYDYLLDKNDNKYKLNWKIQDFVSNCEFDLIVGFLNDTFKITDLDKNGIAEVWTMYQMGCVSDVSPIDKKIIMYQGKQKFALRGTSVVNPGDGKIGGEYKLDENMNNAPKEIKAFAIEMWKKNSLQKYE